MKKCLVLIKVAKIAFLDNPKLTKIPDYPNKMCLTDFIYSKVSIIRPGRSMLLEFEI